MRYFERFYAEATSGLHRENTEAFLAREAGEKLFHLGAGERLLDFGCGTADLTVYYARAFRRIVAADFSANMLQRARARIDSTGATGIELVLGDDKSVWDRLGADRFEVITTAGVLQHLSEHEVETFNARAREFLAPGGRIVHFDIPDPRIYLLVRLGAFGPTPWRWRDLPRSLYLLAKLAARRLVDAVKGHPTDIMGYQHHPAVLRAIAERCGGRAEIVGSMYYEYRYHAIIRFGPDDAPASAG